MNKVVLMIDNIMLANLIIDIGSRSRRFSRLKPLLQPELQLHQLFLLFLRWFEIAAFVVIENRLHDFLGFIDQFQQYFNPLFCPEGRQVAWQHLTEAQFTPQVGGTYACTRGPRMDTRAEGVAYQAMGATVVGQALIPEVFVAKELEICYTAIGYVAYWADGVVDREFRAGVPFEGLLTPEEAQKVELVEKALPTFFMEWLVDLFEQPRECPCKDTMLRYKRRGDISEDWKQWIR